MKSTLKKLYPTVLSVLFQGSGIVALPCKTVVDTLKAGVKMIDIRD